MAGIAIVLDLLRKNPSFSLGQTLHSYGVFSAKLAASAASASIAATTPFASRAFFGNVGARVALCDAGAGLAEDYISSLTNDSTVNFQLYSSKFYPIEQKPLLSAFYLKNFVLICWKSFLLFYMPLLDDDYEDFLQDSQVEKRVDLINRFKESVKHIGLQATVITTKHLLERISVHYVSQRMAWKLLKDLPKSAARKATRGMPTVLYVYSVSKTTFRGHCLGFLASWIVQVGIDICRLFRSKDDRKENVRLLGKKVYIDAVRCGVSLVFASIEAGIVALFLRPTNTSQWIGCAIGEAAGPVIVSMCIEKVLHLEL